MACRDDANHLCAVHAPEIARSFFENKDLRQGLSVGSSDLRMQAFAIKPKKIQKLG